MGFVLPSYSSLRPQLWTVNIVRKSIKFQVTDCSVWLLHNEFPSVSYSASLKSDNRVFVLPFHNYLFNSKREVLSFFKRGEGSWRSWVSEYLTYFPSMLHSLKLSLDSNPWLLSIPTPAISKTQLNGSCPQVSDTFFEALLSLGWLSVSGTRGRPRRAGWQCDLAAGNTLPAVSGMCFVCSGGFRW